MDWAMTFKQLHSPNAGGNNIWRSVLVVDALAIGTAVNYFGWLGWHPTNPETWHIAGLVLVQVALIVGAMIVRPFSSLPILVVPATMTACFAIDASQVHVVANMWPVGAVFLLVGSLLATMTVFGLAQGILTAIRVFRGRAGSR